MRDEKKSLIIEPIIMHAKGTTGDTLTATASTIDLSTAGAVTISVLVGSVSGANTEGVLTVMECDTADGDFTRVEAGNLSGDSIASLKVADANTLKKLAYTGKKRYIKVELTGEVGDGLTDVFNVSVLSIKTSNKYN